MPRNHIKSIAVYCGSADEIKPVYQLAARQLGSLFAQHGIRMIYGGGKTGLMGVVADSLLSKGGEVIGVVPGHLNQPQLIHSNLTALEVTPDIQTRQRRMLEMADAAIALPGGFGTFYELLESLTLAQIGIHRKPIGILNANGYFDPLTVLFEHACVEGFIYPEHLELLIVSADPGELIGLLADYRPPETLARWVERSKPFPGSGLDFTPS